MGTFVAAGVGVGVGGVGGEEGGDELAVRRVHSHVVVAGALEDHEALARRRRGGGTEERFALRQRNQLVAIAVQNGAPHRRRRAQLAELVERVGERLEQDGALRPHHRRDVGHHRQLEDAAETRLDQQRREARRVARREVHGAHAADRPADERAARRRRVAARLREDRRQSVDERVGVGAQRRQARLARAPPVAPEVDGEHRAAAALALAVQPDAVVHLGGELRVAVEVHDQRLAAGVRVEAVADLHAARAGVLAVDRAGVHRRALLRRPRVEGDLREHRRVEQRRRVAAHKSTQVHGFVAERHRTVGAEHVRRRLVGVAALAVVSPRIAPLQTR